MFGYIKPDLPNLYIKDSVLYRSMYCGLCKSIGANCGTVSRFTLNYDMAFLSTLFHNIMDKDVVIKDEKCIMHQIVKRPMASRDYITDVAAYLNVFFTYYKLTDDIEDLKKGRFKRSFFKKGYKKSLKVMPELEKIIKDRYSELVRIEKEACDSIDIAADPFGNMIKDISVLVLKEYSNADTEALCYGIGKFVYLIDALDDYNKDIKKDNYNVFYNAYKCSDYDELLIKFKNDIEFVFGSIFKIISDSLKNIKFYFNHDLTDNILLKGLPQVTKKILNKEKIKCKKIHSKF
jgi:hypothetical protein